MKHNGRQDTRVLLINRRGHRIRLGVSFHPPVYYYVYVTQALVGECVREVGNVLGVLCFSILYASLLYCYFYWIALFSIADGFCRSRIFLFPLILDPAIYVL